MTLLATYRAGLVLQYLDEADGEWKTFGTAHDLGTLVRTRRFSMGPRQSVTARKWRLIKKGGPDYGTARYFMDTMRFWTETAELSPVRVLPFSFNDSDQSYHLVRTAGNLEVYRNRVRMAAIPAPHEGDQVREVSRAQVLDTLLQFHADVRTHRVMRQGAHDQWDSRDLTYASVPIFDFTGERAGGVNEIQRVRFDDYAAGDSYQLVVEGEVTDTLVFSGGDDSAAILAALEALPNIGPAGVTVTAVGGDEYEIEYVGENRAQDVAEIAGKTIVTAGTGIIICHTVQQGKAGGEPVISDARGWPATGAFYQQRLWIGGLKSRPQTAIGSRLGDYFQFDSKGTATAVNIDIYSDDACTIRAIYGGQNLQFFTASSEFFVPVEPITPPSGVKRTSRRGAEAGIPLDEISGATLFICSGGQAAAEYVFDASDPSSAQGPTYKANFLSRFATHLLAGTPRLPRRIVDMGFRRAKTPEQSDRAIMVRDDGRGVVMAALREDGVTGFMGWSTQGLFLAATADLARNEVVAVQRELEGGAEILLEAVDDLALLDSQVSRTVTAPEAASGGVTTIPVPHLNGRTVTVYADGADRGDVPVIGGVATFEPPALREVSAGLSFTPSFVTLPAVQEQDPRAGSEAEPQAAVVALHLGPTGGQVQVGILGEMQVDGASQQLWDLPMPQPVVNDEGAGEYEGWTESEGMPGFRPLGQVVVAQVRPGPFEVKEIVIQVDS